MEYIPKPGNEIYFDSAFYSTHGEDDFIGGLRTITYIEEIGPQYFWIEIAEDRGRFTWHYNQEEQERLKAKFGTKRGELKPDFRVEFDRLQ